MRIAVVFTIGFLHGYMLPVIFAGSVAIGDWLTSRWPGTGGRALPVVGTCVVLVTLLLVQIATTATVTAMMTPPGTTGRALPMGFLIGLLSFWLLPTAENWLRRR